MSGFVFTAEQALRVLPCQVNQYRKQYNAQSPQRRVVKRYLARAIRGDYTQRGLLNGYLHKKGNGCMVGILVIHCGASYKKGSLVGNVIIKSFTMAHMPAPYA